MNIQLFLKKMAENSFDEIKKLMKIVGGKVIIVEDGKPTMVIINVDEYIGFEKGENFEKDKSGNLSNDEGIVEKINRSINIWKDKQEERKLKQLEKNDYKETGGSHKESEEKKKGDNEIVIERL